MIDHLERTLATALGESVAVTHRAPLGGGCISHVERLDTTAGPFVLKWKPDAPTGFFEAEAAGLEALRGAGSGLVIPRVITLGTSYILLEFLPPDRPARDSHDRLGRGLAALHRTSAPHFGFHRDTFCGATRQPNPWTPRWIPFYASARLGDQTLRATDAGRLTREDGRKLDRLIDRLDTLLSEPPEGPSLVHGDLWSGNLHLTQHGAPALIDPAASYAHREMEFGMMTLFGGFSTRVFDAYAEGFPLDPGWRDRQPLYQLFHLLNHLNLFGAGYHGQVMSVVGRFV